MKDIHCPNNANQSNKNDFLLDDMADCMTLINDYESLAIIISLAKNRIMHLNNDKNDIRFN